MVLIPLFFACEPTQIKLASDSGTIIGHDGTLDSGETTDSGTEVTDTEVTDTEVTDTAPLGIPIAEWEPEEVSDGMPSPLDGVYEDQGPADESDEFRSLIGLPIRNLASLGTQLRNSSDPNGTHYQQYLSTADWDRDYAPTQEDFSLIQQYLEYEGFHVDYLASNRLLIQFSGTVGQFNAAFQTNLHVCDRTNPQVGGDSFPVYCTTTSMTLPRWVSEITNGIITADTPVDPGPLPGEAGSVEYDPPGDMAMSPALLAQVYGLQALWDQGYTGQGVRLGVVIGGMFKFNDINTFWSSFNINHLDPEVIETSDPPPSRNIEATLDVSWSGAMAPDAEQKVYVGPDARNTSMVFAFNEAIGLGEIDILTDSFAHREDSEPMLVRDAYDQAAMEGAALGITITAASGDSGGVDIPCSSAYVTCVGGSTLDFDRNGDVRDEIAWEYGGSGDAKTFDAPYWQSDVRPNATYRAVTDVAISAGNPYWLYYLGSWYSYYGTSFSSPVFAGSVATINSWRAANAKAPVGYLNPTLYQNVEVQGTFRDITQGRSAYSAETGWDYPTGWGGLNAEAFAAAMP